jgi:hypothetical protein
MKTLIYELFTGVGFCNQLFSLETAIYLANISNRKLILLIRHPLCHCGSAKWEFGKFLNLFSDDYLKYLPNGIEIHYSIPSANIINIINDTNLTKKFIYKTKFSSLVFVDPNLDNEINAADINKFLNGREKEYLNFEDHDNYEYFYINQSNASRCFYNFYTTIDNYILMNNITKSLTLLQPNINNIFNKIRLPEKFICIHFRFGDHKHNTDTINNRTPDYINNIDINHISNLNLPIVVMCDRKDSAVLDLFKNNNIEILFTDNIIEPYIQEIKDTFKDYKRIEVIQFLIEKQICEKSTIFYANNGSTVSNYINYVRYINNLNYCNLYSNTKDKIIKDNQISWFNNSATGSLSWRSFWTVNVIKNISNSKYYLNIIEFINIDKRSNKKIISYCLFDINKKNYNDKRKNIDYFKGLLVNYELKKQVYPDWIIRVYLPYNEPRNYIELIKKFTDIEIILIDTNIPYRMLRLLPYNDNKVLIWLSRDLDSVLNLREKSCVDDWLTNYTDKDIHIMHDANGHNFIMVGLLGVKNNKNNNCILNYIFNQLPLSSYSGDSVICQNFLFSEDNYIQHYRAGLKLSNSCSFPINKLNSSDIVGNIVNIDTYYNNYNIENIYKFVKDFYNNITLTITEINELNSYNILENNNLFSYTPWKCHKDPPICKLYWINNDILMTIHDSSLNSGLGTFKTENGDALKLINIGTTINILWENKKYVKAYMLNKNTIIVVHNNKNYYFNKV